MAGKITELTELATVDDADLLEIVDDVAGTPTSKKITVANLLADITEGVVVPNYRAELTLPGVVAQNFTTLALNAKSIFYAPVQFDRAGTITELHCNITTQAAGGNRLKLLLYNASADLITVGALRAESGHIAADTTGAKSYTLASPIAAERGDAFMVAIWVEAAITVNIARGSLRGSAIKADFAGSLNSLRVSSATYGGAAADPGSAINTISWGSTGLAYPVFLKVT